MPLEEITSPSLSPRCMRCMLDKHLDACPADVPWQRRAEYFRRVMSMVADGSQHMTAPEISHELNGVLHEMFGIAPRDFTQVKRHFNQLVLRLVPQLTQRLSQNDDPLDLAIRFALAGNFIDFGPTGDVDETKLLQLLGTAVDMELDESAMGDLKARIRAACAITYLTDNCGEVVLDRLLIEQIVRVNPHVRVTAVVRGADTSNDATMVDARQVGLNEVARVIDNGTDVAGTCPTRVNEQTRDALRCADLVISKGLANYETLSGRGERTYFLFLAKCSLYVEVFDVPLYAGMVVRGE